MHHRRALALLTALGAIAGGCPGPAPHPAATTLSFGSSEAHVAVRLEPVFGFAISDGAGHVVLDTDDGAPATGDAGGTSATSGYAAIAASRRIDNIHPPTVIEGWDHVQASEQDFRRATRVVRSSASGAGATFDLVDPGETTTAFHVEIAVHGAEVEVTAAATPSQGPLGSTRTGDGGAPAPINLVSAAFVLGADEHFFGLGERFVSVDHRNRRYECWVEEGGLGLGETAPPGPTNPAPNGPGMTGIPIPFLLSSHGYGLWVETTARTGFVLGTDDPGAFRVYAHQPALHYHVLVHADPRDTIAHFTQLTGRARLPAAWVFGPRRRVDPGNTVAGVPEEQALRDQRVPTTAIDDTTHFLPSGSEVGRESALFDWTTHLHALGFRAIAYFNAYVSLSDTRASDLVAYGRAHDLFLRLDDGSEFDTPVSSGGFQPVATIDLTSPDAVAWYDTLLDRALGLGYDGWMLDFGEYVPQHARFHDGSDGWTTHNAFPLLQQRATFEHLTAVRGNDFQFFARSGYVGTQAIAPVIWSGDPASSFDDEKGLPAQVRAMLNAGLSGLPFWGSDISGYACTHDGPADKEVYLRWAEFGALSPDMHDENACAGAPPGSPPKWTLWSDAETTTVYGDYARLHTRLIPYLYAAANEAANTGLPVARHPWLINPSAPEAAGVELEYWFGPALYVAPVVRRGATSRTAWLPPGTWFDWWTLQPVAGGAMVTRDAPVDLLPLWLRAGGVVAMLDPSIETLAEGPSPGVVGPDDVRDVLDVRAALTVAGDGSAGRSELVDGTVLETALGGGDAGAAIELPTEIALAPDEATLATCASCGRIDPVVAGVVRVRITTRADGEVRVQAGALGLHHHAPRALRVRWDVLVATE